MKVYIVTTGELDDYAINKVLSNKEKAEEYAEWLEDSNEVKEFEVVDDICFEKRYVVNASLELYDDGKEKIHCDIYKTMDKDFNQINYFDYRNRIEISIYRTLNVEVIDELYYKRKCKKELYDIAKFVKDKLANGYNEKKINELLKNKKLD